MVSTTDPYQGEPVSSPSTNTQNQAPPAFVTLSEVLLYPYDTDYNPYAAPLDRQAYAAQNPEGRRLIYGLGSGGVLQRGLGSNLPETPTAQQLSPYTDLLSSVQHATDIGPGILPNTRAEIPLANSVEGNGAPQIVSTGDTRIEEAEQDLSQQGVMNKTPVGDDEVNLDGGPKDQHLGEEDPQVELDNSALPSSQPPATDWKSALLPNEAIAQLVQNEYDPMWFQKTALDPSVLSGWTSRQKLSEFFHVIFKVGDEFRLSVILEGASIEESAIVHSIRPNTFKIRPYEAGGTPLITPVHGLGELEADLIKEAGGQKKRKPKPTVPYQAVQVIRGGQSLGNLHDIRQIYHLYQDQVEVWAVRTKQYHLAPFPRRQQPPHGTNMVYKEGVLMQPTEDGSLVHVENQLMFRTTIFMARRGSDVS